MKSANYVRRSKQSDNQSHCCGQQQDENHEVSEECYHCGDTDYWKTDCLKWLETTAGKEHLKKKQLDDDEGQRSDSCIKRRGVVWRTSADDDDIKSVSCLDEDNAGSIYSTVRMTINDNIDQDNKMEELEPVTLIEKKDHHDNSNNWIIDSDASHHMTWNQDFFIVYKLKKSWVTVVNRAQIELPDCDDIIIKQKTTSKTIIQLIDILFMSKLNCNLMSILTLIKTQLQVNFTFKRVKIHWDQDLIVTGFIREKSFVLNLSPVTDDIAFRAKSVKLTVSVKLMSIPANSPKLPKLARSTMESTIEQEPPTCNNKLIHN